MYYGHSWCAIMSLFVGLMTDTDAVQLNCATSVAADFYFRSHLGCLLDSESAGGIVASQMSTASTVGRVEMDSVSAELQQAVTVDLTLILLWKVKRRHYVFKLFAHRVCLSIDSY